MDDLIAEFLTETSENLLELDAGMVELEQNPNDTALLSQIFRVIHTIKGTCGFLGLPRLEKVAHKAEDVLGLFRDGKLEVTPAYVSLILGSIDRIKYIIGEIEAKGAEPEGNDDELVARLAAVLESSENTDLAITPENDPFLNNPVAHDETLVAEELERPVPEPVQKKTAMPSAEAGMVPREASLAAQTLRVNVDVLENLMTMVSELVLNRNQLLQILRSHTESEFASPLQRLNHVVSDLQDGVMKTRMQPVGNAWAKLPRIIRDISHDLGKRIDLEMRGQDTELDRQVLDLIKDPLTHMVRNSADHGIETPAERAAAGKPETGKIRLNSYHEGGHIIIEISDDGRGLSLERIKAKAIKNGLASAEELTELSAQQIQQFIFKPGFSTAEQVTAVSGRGVGMDVVRTNIEKIGGSIELKSTEGKGTAVIIKIPLTLAIVSALIVESRGEKFAIPQLTVKELVTTSADGESRIETLKGTPVFRLRDHLLPLVSLEELLKLSPGHAAQSRDADEARYAHKYIVVAQVGTYMFGIIVDRVFDTEEIVIKPVPNILRELNIFSGNTILGDGSVIMILDPSGIVKQSGEIEMTEAIDNSAGIPAAHGSKRKTSLLLFNADGDTPKAVPLELVSRLEEVRTEEIEKTSGSYVVQYRGALMPLVPFSQSMTFSEKEKVPVLVFSDRHRSMGLIVDRIIDITEENVEIQTAETVSDLIGCAIIDGQATDIINVSAFLQRVSKNWFKDHGDEPYVESKSKNGHGNGHVSRVLLVEDSPFFRHMLTPILKVAGYDVTTTENAIQALKLCDAGHDFDVIVSDIEMPEMSGFEFAETLRESESWRNIPLIALSSHTTPQDFERGKKAGFLHHIPKFDREILLKSLSQALAARYGEGDHA